MKDNKPFQNEFRPKLVNKVVNQIPKGETSALIGLPGVGKTNTIHWIKKRAKEKKSILLIHLDLNNLVRLADLAFYRLFLLEIHRSVKQQISDKTISSFSKEIYDEIISTQDDLLTFDGIKRIFQKILNDTDLTICTLLDGFEKLTKLDVSIFNSLMALRSLDKVRIAYLFIGSSNLERNFPPEKTGDLYALLNYNKYWLGLLNKEESMALIDEFCSLLETNLNKNIKEKIYEYSGGHAWYIKVLTKLFTEDTNLQNLTLEELSKLSSLESRAVQVWTSLEQKQSDLIEELVKGKKKDIDNFDEYLRKSGLVHEKDQETKLFSPIFEEFVKRVAEKNGHSFSEGNHLKDKQKGGLGIDLDRRLVTKDNKIIENTFTRNEFKLVKYFFENESLAITRDDIAEVLWGKDANMKYSDWAIDKIISRIRDKIEDNSRKPEHLLTIRGIGFKFTSSGK